MNNNQDNLNINPEMNNLNNQNQYNSRFFNNSNGLIQNQQTTLNVIPQMQPENNINQNVSNNNFLNNQNGFVQNQQTTLNVIPKAQLESFENNNQELPPQQPNNNIIPNQISNPNNNFSNNSINTNLDSNFNNGQYNNNLDTNIVQGFNNNINNEINRDSILNNDGITAFQNQNRFITENQTNTSLNDLNVEGEYNGLPKIDYSQDPKVIKNIESSKKKNTITITGEAKVFLIIIAVLLIFTFVMPTIFDFIRDIQY